MIRPSTWVYDVEIAPNFIGITFIPLKYGNANYQNIIDTYVKVDILLKEETLNPTDSNRRTKLLEDKQMLLKAMGAKIFNVFRDGKNSINNLVELNDFFSTERILYGYNSNNYDKTILSLILCNYPYLDFEGYSRKTQQHITQIMYQHSQLCISYGNSYGRSCKELYRFKAPFQDYDIQKILYLDKSFVALKQVAIALRWYRIQTLPYKYDQLLQADFIPDVNDYNVNDVLITRHLILNQIEEVLLREELSIEFNSNLYNLSRSSISTRLFSHFYSLFTGLEYKDFKDLRTDRKYIRLADIIKPNISFNDPELKQFLDKVLQKTIVVGSKEDDDKFLFEISFKGTVYTMGLGGLHSQDKADLFSTDDGYLYTDADVTSYYPNGILNLDVYPAHLDRVAFRACIGYIKDSRVTAKREGRKAKAEGLKITINAAYGKLKDMYSFLYDPICTYTTTINLQLYLLILIERLNEVGIRVISANTDGIVSRYLSNQHDDYIRICNEWEKEFNFGLEYVDYEKYIRSSVNDYIAVKKGFYENLAKGEDRKKLLKDYVKFKGSFIDEPVFNKGYFAPVIPKAIMNYFIFGVDYKEFITNYIKNNPDKGIYDFCISQKVDKKFQMIINKVEDGKIVIEDIQNTNRFYVTNDKTTTIIKFDDQKDKTLTIRKGVGIHIFNDYVKKEDYNIDYSFYLAECNRVIRGKKKSIKASKKPRNLSDDGIVKSQLRLFE